MLGQPVELGLSVISKPSVVPSIPMDPEFVMGGKYLVPGWCTPVYYIQRIGRQSKVHSSLEEVNLARYGLLDNRSRTVLQVNGI